MIQKCSLNDTISSSDNDSLQPDYLKRKKGLFAISRPEKRLGDAIIECSLLQIALRIDGGEGRIDECSQPEAMKDFHSQEMKYTCEKYTVETAPSLWVSGK